MELDRMHLNVLRAGQCYCHTFLHHFWKAMVVWILRMVEGQVLCQSCRGQKRGSKDLQMDQSHHSPWIFTGQIWKLFPSTCRTKWLFRTADMDLPRSNVARTLYTALIEGHAACILFTMTIMRPLLLSSVLYL